MVGVAASLALAAALTALVVRLGPALGYEDRPDDPLLKAHTRPAVPLGGVAIFAAVHVGLIIAGEFEVELLGATGILLVLGLVDDRVGLSPLLRLGVTAGAGVVLALGSESLEVGVLLVAGVVVAVNAVNLYDGLDGLAGLAGAVSALAAAGIAGVTGAEPVAGLVVTAGLAGFLFFNWHPAKAFLGDNGSYVLALLLVWLIARPGDNVGEITATFGILGVFIVDLLVTVIRRRQSGAPLFTGDRSHVYDRLHQAGMSVPMVAVTSATAQALLAGATLIFVWLLSPGWALLATGLLGVGAVAVLAFGGIVPAPAEEGS